MSFAIFVILVSCCVIGSIYIIGDLLAFIIVGEHYLTSNFYIVILVIDFVTIFLYVLYFRRKFKKNAMKAYEVREFQKTEEEEKQRHLEQIDRERKEVLEEQQRALVEAEQLREEEEEERLRQNEPQNHIKAIKCEYCDSSVFIRWGENNTCPYCGAHLTF